MKRKNRLKLNQLSLEITGVASKWQQILRKGVLALTFQSEKPSRKGKFEKESVRVFPKLRELYKDMLKTKADNIAAIKAKGKKK